MTDVREYRCTICNINYASRQSLCNHNKKFHRNNISNNISNQYLYQHLDQHLDNQKKIICKYCHKIFSFNQSKWVHEKKCKKNINIINNNIINNDNRQITNNITKNDNRQIINNNIKFIIKKNGTENLEDLTEEEIKQILLKNGEGITKFIELLNFNKELPQNHTFCTTNLKSKYLDVYNTDTNTIEKDRKKYFFDHLLKNAVDGIKKLIDLHKKENFIVENNNLITEMLRSSIEFGSKFLNDKILKELFNKIELISYNKKKIVKDTWDGKTNSNNCYIRRIKKLINKINKDRIKN